MIRSGIKQIAENRSKTEANRWRKTEANSNNSEESNENQRESKKIEENRWNPKENQTKSIKYWGKSKKFDEI